ncbi:MAG: phage protease [bacterium]
MKEFEASCTLTEVAADSIGDDNRQWVHLMPAGKLVPRDGRKPWRVLSASTLVQRSEEYAGGRGIPVDYEHQTDKAEVNGQPAPAAGWIEKLESRKDGVWGLVRWTERAAAHIREREYRFISPTFNHDKAGIVIRILRAALTNKPALELKALAATETATMNLNEEQFADLQGLLNLNEDADGAQVLAAVRELNETATAATPDPAKYVPIEALEAATAELNKVSQGVTQERAERCVADEIGRGRLPPFLKEWATQLCTVNKPAFDSFVEKTGKTLAPLFERGPASGKRPGEATALTAEEQAVCNNMGLTAEDFQKYGAREQ